MRTLIANARIIDGTGAPAREGELPIEDATIAAVGNVDGDGKPDHVLDARGMVVAPGFVDMHSTATSRCPTTRSRRRRCYRA